MDYINLVYVMIYHTMCVYVVMRTVVAVHHLPLHETSRGAGQRHTDPPRPPYLHGSIY